MNIYSSSLDGKRCQKFVLTLDHLIISPTDNYFKRVVFYQINLIAYLTVLTSLNTRVHFDISSFVDLLFQTFFLSSFLHELFSLGYSLFCKFFYIIYTNVGVVAYEVINECVGRLQIFLTAFFLLPKVFCPFNFQPFNTKTIQGILHINTHQYMYNMNRFIQPFSRQTRR